jgi:hypothetical protein
MTHDRMAVLGAMVIVVAGLLALRLAKDRQ